MTKKTIIATLFLSITSNLLQAEVMTHYFSQKEKRQITIEKHKGMSVNDECLKNLSECMALLTPVKRANKSASKINHPRGNPASDFCESIKGNPAILHDQKNNEYDYCLIKGKYFVDSWDLYKANSK